MTDENSTTTHRSMGRPPQHMKEIKVQFPAETLEQIDSLVGNKFRSKFIRAAVDGGEQQLEGADHQGVGGIVVVAVLGHAVDQPLAQLLLLPEVRVEGGDEVGQVEVAAVPDHLPQGGQGIGDAADAHRLDEGVVVPGAPRVVVAPLRDAVALLLEVFL